MQPTTRDNSVSPASSLGSSATEYPLQSQRLMSMYSDFDQNNSKGEKIIKKQEKKYFFFKKRTMPARFMWRSEPTRRSFRQWSTITKFNSSKSEFFLSLVQVRDLWRKCKLSPSPNDFCQLRQVSAAN